MFDSIKQWWKTRRWKKEQLPYVKEVLYEDERWLAHDPVARALIKRYITLLENNWYQLPVTPIRDFRRKLGLDPNDERSSPASHRKEAYQCRGLLTALNVDSYDKALAKIILLTNARTCGPEIVVPAIQGYLESARRLREEAHALEVTLSADLLCIIPVPGEEPGSDVGSK